MGIRRAGCDESEGASATRGGSQSRHGRPALGVARTVTYHAGKLAENIDDRCARRYDWAAIRRHYEEGHSVAARRTKFGFKKETWHAAILRGRSRLARLRSHSSNSSSRGPRRNRNHLKRRMFQAGVKTRRCECCGLSEWRGGAIPLTLHHANGDRHDNRLEDLRILCPNCLSQTDTWAGRNGRRDAALRSASHAQALDADT